jgi:uncharacterized membrane protein YqaE (UPF0057 family)
MKTKAMLVNIFQTLAAWVIAIVMMAAYVVAVKIVWREKE